MSAGPAEARVSVSRDLTLLAPRFHAAVESALADCHTRGLDAMVHEGYRSAMLQALYYNRGRTVIPPPSPVTNARDNLSSWHGYCLAVDVISSSRRWDAGYAWFAEVAQSFQRYGCRWGGEWKMKDLPHFQWARCRPSPSPRAREILQTEGLSAVWTVVGAA
jgi:peptidoglycan LD-endopeptidase CwlK